MSCPAGWKKADGVEFLLNIPDLPPIANTLRNPTGCSRTVSDLKPYVPRKSWREGIVPGQRDSGWRGFPRH